MRPVWFAAAGLTLTVAAFAQNAPIQSFQLPPLQEQERPAGSPPAQQTPSPPVEAPPAEMSQRPNVWVPAGAVQLKALDKVNAQATALTIKVGESATFGSLTITVKACVVRPPDQPADAAAYLMVKDSHPDSPDFNGWMLQAEPSVSMMQNPVYDVRVAGCT